MSKKKQGSGTAWLVATLSAKGLENNSAMITQASVDGINLLSTVYRKDEYDNNESSYHSPIEIMTNLTIDYAAAGVGVFLKAPLRAVMEDMVVISSISTMIDAIRTERFWFDDANKRFTLDSSDSVRLVLTSVDALLEAQETDLVIEEGTTYDPNIAGWVKLNEDQISVVSKLYSEILNDPEKHNFLQNDLAIITQELKDEAVADLESNID